jgi:sugar lactone lactonase YvrE
MPRRLLRPRRRGPPAPTARARQTASTTPLPPLRLIPLPAPGPEDVVVDREGMLLTGVADGRILRVDPADGSWTEVADTGGRPLGLEPCPDGTILCCDSRRGLLRVGVDGVVDVLVEEIDGVRLNFASNVVRDDDGTVYFSASTRRFDLEHYLGDMLEHSGTGRLFRRTPDGQVETLLDGLDFANGVVLAPDRSCVVVAQTGGYCVTRYWLRGPKAGTSEPLIENLPGFPDNMALGSDGLIWVSIPTARNPLLDRLLPLPGFLRQATWLLPEALRPAPARTVWALALDWDGGIVHDRQGPGTDYAMVTSAIERAGTVYLGSLHEPAIAVFELG